MSQEKIYKFDKELLNMHLKPEHQATVNGKKTILRLTKGDTELEKKKQPEFAVPQDFLVSNLQMIVDDETTQRWLESKPYFGSKITIYDPVAETKEKNDAFMYAVKVAVAASKLSDIEVRTVGYELYGKEALAMEMESLKLSINEEIQEDAERVEKVIHSNEKSDKTFTAIAFVKNIIQESNGGTEVVWADNDAKITSVTKGVQPIDAMVDLYKTAEGKQVKQEIALKIKALAADKVIAKAKDADKKGKEDAADNK